MIVRPMHVGDLEQMAALARDPSLSRWSSVQLQAELEDGNTLGLAGIEEGEMQGYVFARVTADEGELLHICVREDRRRAGVARMLLEAVLARMRERGVCACYLEVRCGNAAAIVLYRKTGFLVVGRRSRYYRAPQEDALVMCRALL